MFKPFQGLVHPTTLPIYRRIDDGPPCLILPKVLPNINFWERGKTPDINFIKQPTRSPVLLPPPPRFGR